jgi:hypothetical protein
MLHFMSHGLADSQGQPLKTLWIIAQHAATTAYAANEPQRRWNRLGRSTTAAASRGNAYVMESGRIVLAGQAKDLLDDENVRRAYLG